MADLIRHIQPPAVNIAFPYPIGRHINKIIPSLRIIQVQLGHVSGIAEGLVAGAFSPFHHQRKAVYIVPVQIRGFLPLLPNILERKKVYSRMVKHTIQNHIHPRFMSHSYKFLQLFLIPKGGINPVIIVNIVFMDGI